MLSRLLYLLLLGLSVHHHQAGIEASTHWLLNTNGQIIPQVRTGKYREVGANWSEKLITVLELSCDFLKKNAHCSHIVSTIDYFFAGIFFLLPLS